MFLGAFAVALLSADLMSYYGIPFIPVEGRRGTNQNKNIEALVVTANASAAYLDSWIERGAFALASMSRARLDPSANWPPGTFVGYSERATDGTLTYVRGMPARPGTQAIELMEGRFAVFRTTYGGVTSELLLDATETLASAASNLAGTSLPGLRLTIVNREGEPLFGDKEFGFRSAILDEVLGAETSVETFRSDGARVFAYAPETKLPGIAIVAYVTERDLLTEAAKRRARTVVFDAIAAALGVAMILILAGRIFKTIHSLSVAALGVSKGDMEANLPDPPPGELGILVRSFRSMLDRVKRWYGEMERAVKQRTAEIELRNRAAECFLGRRWVDALSELERVVADGCGLRDVTVEYLHDGDGELDEIGVAYVRGESGVCGAIRYAGGTLDAVGIVERIANYVAPLFDARKREVEAERERNKAEESVRLSERRFRALFEQAPDAVVITDSSFVVLGMNRAAENEFGSEWRSMPTRFEDYVLDDYNRNYFHACLAEHRAVRDLEAPLRTRWGDRIEALLTARAVEDGDEFMIFVKDVTERVQAERALWKTNEALAETNKELRGAQLSLVKQAKLASIGLLAAGIAHEINNPLGFLKSNGETMARYAAALAEFAAMARRVSGGAAAEDLEREAERLDLDFIAGEMDKIDEESREGFRRIIEIIAALKNFAREDSTLSFSLYDVNRGMESSIAMAMNEIKYVAELDREYAPLPLIPARGNEVNQVFLNLLVNAAHAIAATGREGKGLIRVTTLAEGDRAVIKVSDNGIGMTRETQEKIFDPFFTMKEPGHGTGLGLSITYDIVVNKHKGDIRVESALGEGATFIVSLPLAQSAGDAPSGDDASDGDASGDVET